MSFAPITASRAFYDAKIMLDKIQNNARDDVVVSACKKCATHKKTTTLVRMHDAYRMRVCVSFFMISRMCAYNTLTSAPKHAAR